MEKLKTILRYPGGKARAIKAISEQIPDNKFDLYVEPMLGGGSVFCHLKQNNFATNYWINDIYSPVIDFWKSMQTNNKKLYKLLFRLWEHINKPENDTKKIEIAKKIYNKIIKIEYSSELNRGFKFFFLNRCTFSGISNSGGFSGESSIKRFTKSSIDRLLPFDDFLKEVKITNDDTLNILPTLRKNTFVYCDPPYISAHKLYGSKGNCHDYFKHLEFARCLLENKDNFKFLITYDNAIMEDENLKKIYSTFNVIPWSLTYGMDSFVKKNTKIGKEIFIRNY